MEVSSGRVATNRHLIAGVQKVGFFVLVSVSADWLGVLRVRDVGLRRACRAFEEEGCRSMSVSWRSFESSSNSVLSYLPSVSAPLSDEGEGTFWALIRSAHDCAGSLPGFGFGFVFDFVGGSCSPRRRAFLSFSRNSIRLRASRYSSCFVVTSFCRALIERDNLASRSSCRSFSSSRRTVESSSRTA